MSWLVHCKIGFDREICWIIDVLVISVEQQTAELQICTVCLISWHHLPLLERVQVASREGHQGNFQIGQIIPIKTACWNFSLKAWKHGKLYEFGAIFKHGNSESSWKVILRNSLWNAAGICNHIWRPCFCMNLCVEMWQEVCVSMEVEDMLHNWRHLNLSALWIKWPSGELSHHYSIDIAARYIQQQFHKWFQTEITGA